MKNQLTGQTVVVIGGTLGIGLESRLTRKELFWPYGKALAQTFMEED